MTYPTARGVVAICAEREAAAEAAEAARRALGAAGGTDGGTNGTGLDAVVLHTALEGHTGPWLGVVRAVGATEVLVPPLEEAATTGLYEAEFRRVRAHPRTWAAGEQTPGLGLLFAVVRRADISHEQFDEHWRDRHAPLALRHHVGMWDYVQCSFVRPLRPDSAELDGMAVCQFASREDLKERFYDSPEGRAVIEADVRRMSDVARSPAMRMVERILT
jgi:uncharacterized protein (TIGR02118 family)